MKKMNKTNALALSGMVIAMYVTIMYFTQSIAFYAHQVRIATSLYALSYLFPFLIIPFGIANFLSNILMGGLGLQDAIGGALVGIITSGAIYLVRRFRLPSLLIVPIIILGPGLIVPLWLAPILQLPYFSLVISLFIGQSFPAVLGYLLVKTLSKMGVGR